VKSSHLWNYNPIEIAIHNWLVVLTILKNMKVNGKDYPIYYGKYKMFQTTNQIIIEITSISGQKTIVIVAPYPNWLGAYFIMIIPCYK